MRYNKRLGAYILQYDELASFDMELLKNKREKYILEVENTRGLTKEFLEKFKLSNFSVQIRGGYTKERVRFWNNLNVLAKDSHSGVLGKRGISYYEDAIIYSVYETIEIISEFENLEREIQPQWSKIKKALYIYDALREKIVYESSKAHDNSYKIRTLRGLLSGRAVCAGYALIFKEAMDRLGIECDYVEGVTTNKEHSKYQTTHAWNLLKINGLTIPLDLTSDAGKYRRGDSKAFSDFSNLAKFKEKHFPSALEKVQNYENDLSGIRSSFVLKTIESFRAKRRYTNSIFRLETADKTDVLVAQIGYDEKRMGPKMYRYLWTKVDENCGTVSAVLYSPVNLLETMLFLERGIIDTTSEKYKIISYLFSERNVMNSLEQESSFLGFWAKIEGNEGIHKRECFKKKYPSRFVERSNRYGQNFIIEEEKEKVSVNGVLLTKALIMRFDVDDDGPLTVYEVYSEKSIIEDSSYDYINSFLDFERLEEKTKNLGGYLGYYTDDKRFITNPDLEKKFRTDDVGELTEEDIIPPHCRENPNYLPYIDVEQLYRINERYQVCTDSSGKQFVQDKTMAGKRVDDTRAVTIASFANIWCSKVEYDNPNKEELYNRIRKGSIESLEDNGYIEIEINDYWKIKFLDTNWEDSALAVLFDHGRNSKITTSFFKLQAPYFKDNKENDSGSGMRNGISPSRVGNK